MRYFFGSLRHHDWILNSAIILLVVCGCVSLSSTSPVQFEKQMIWAVIGAVCLYGVSKIDYRLFSVHALPALALYAAGVVGVIAVYVVGVSVRGSERWLDFGLFWVEPVEILKLSLILLLAKYFSQRRVEMYRVRNFVIPGIYVLVPCALVFMHPDLGSSMVLISILLGMLVVAGLHFRHFLILAVGSVLFMVIAWFFILYDYQKVRIVSFLNLSDDPVGASYNTIQSVIAVSSGDVWGRGLGQGTQSQLGFLPEVATDFIFAAIVEEMGVVVGVFMLMLFGVILWRALRILSMTRSSFARLAIIGVVCMFMVQIVSNVGMVIGLLPVTGLTLPFVSYGGSSMVIFCCAFGLLQSIYMNARQMQYAFVEE